VTVCPSLSITVLISSGLIEWCIFSNTTLKPHLLNYMCEIPFVSRPRLL
jgi:hypothetical protein